MRILIRGGNVVNSRETRQVDILIEGEKIAAVGENVSVSEEMEIVEAEGSLVLPGIIDAHTHYALRSRGGNVTADDFYQGSVSAACGGVTTVIDYADQIPGATMLEAAKVRKQEAANSICIDFSLHMTLTDLGPEKWEQLEELKMAGITSYKVFTTYPEAGYMMDDDTIFQLLTLAKRLGTLVTVHAEDNTIIEKAKQKLIIEGRAGPGYHALSRPAAAETEAVRKIIQLAEDAAATVYIAHVSTAGACQAIAEANARGQTVLAETCPHYLLLDNSIYDGIDVQKFIMTPPLRGKDDQQALWEGLQQGTFQVVATDHCAYSLEQKSKGQTCFDTLPGIPGSETLLPLLYSEGVAKGKISLPKLVELLAENPAKIFGLYPRKGCVAPGSDADLVVLNPHTETTLSAKSLHSAAGYTPYEGWKIKGRIEKTLLRGQVVYQDGRFLGSKGGGRFIPAIP